MFCNNFGCNGMIDGVSVAKLGTSETDSQDLSGFAKFYRSDKGIPWYKTRDFKDKKERGKHITMGAQFSFS